MAFEEGIAATTAELLDTFCDFAVANAGFTRIPNKAITTADAITDMYILERGGIYWYFFAISKVWAAFGTYGEIWSRMMTVEPTDANQRDNNLGQYYLTKTSMYSRPDGPFVKNRFYSDGNHVNMVVELTPGGYTHMGIGTLDPYFTFVGGEYLTGTHIYINGYAVNTGWPLGFPNIQDHYAFCEGEHGTSQDEYNNELHGYTHIYLPLDPPAGDSGDFAPSYGDTTASSPNAKGRRSHLYVQTTISDANTPSGTMFNWCTNEDMNNRAIMLPCFAIALDSRVVGGTGDSFYMGQIKTCKSINVRYLSSEDIVEVNWDVYPLTTKGGDTLSYPDSSFYGIAFERIE